MCRILLVEDAQIIREPLARLLQSEGFQVFSAADGQAAMALLEEHGAELILLDVLMPRMDGVRFMESLRADPRWKLMPVIALTGISDTSRLNRIRELGVRAVMQKARFTFEELLTEMRRHLPDSCNAAV